MKVLVTALALAPLLFGLASPPSHASPQACVLAALGTTNDGRVVSQQKLKETSKKKDTEKKSDTESTGPMDVFSDIEKGWNAEEVDAILKHFGAAKVTISIEGSAPAGGQFSKNQSYYLFKDMFKYTITEKFEIVQYRKPSENGNSSFAVAERYYKKTDDGRLFKDKIYISLHRETGGKGATEPRWVIDEIKSIR